MKLLNVRYPMEWASPSHIMTDAFKNCRQEDIYVCICFYMQILFWYDFVLKFRAARRATTTATPKSSKRKARNLNLARLRRPRRLLHAQNWQSTVTPIYAAALPSGEETRTGRWKCGIGSHLVSVLTIGVGYLVERHVVLAKSVQTDAEVD